MTDTTKATGSLPPDPAAEVTGGMPDSSAIARLRAAVEGPLPPRHFAATVDPADLRALLTRCEAVCAAWAEMPDVTTDLEAALVALCAAPDTGTAAGREDGDGWGP